KQARELDADLTATVTVNGKSVIGKRLTATDTEQVTIPSGDVRIAKTGPGRLYWSAREEFYSTDPKLVDTGTIKLNVIREYFRMVEGRKDNRIVYDLKPLDGPLKTGDLLAVRLTVSGTEWRYILAEDPIPSG